jgi:fluoroacetyl-CoA thioesterase
MLLERASMELLRPYLDDGQSSVGVRVEIEHLGPALKGMSVRAITKVARIEGRRIRFQVEVLDKDGKIAKGWHDRFVIDLKKYETRLALKSGN